MDAKMITARQMHEGYRTMAAMPGSLRSHLLNLRPGHFNVGKVPKEFDPAGNSRRLVTLEEVQLKFASVPLRELVKNMKQLTVPNKEEQFQMRALAEQMGPMRPGHEIAILSEGVSSASLLNPAWRLEVDTKTNTIVSVKAVANAY